MLFRSNTEILGNFCHTCGQKSTTHRYSMGHFMQHDVVHGVWHVDNSLPNTLIKLFSRPGHTVREFVEGRRYSLFNFITLIILIPATSSFLSTYMIVKMSDLMSANSKSAMQVLEEFSKKYPKIMMMIMIPIYSVFSFLWFRKAKLNFSEHLVLNSYKACGEMTIALGFSLVVILYPNIEGLKKIYFFIITPMVMLYGFWFYYQFFSKDGYSKKTRLWRSIMPYITVNIGVGILGVIIGIAYFYFKNRH